MTDDKNKDTTVSSDGGKGTDESAGAKIDFSTFIMSLASSAYCCLGMLENPVTKVKEKNLVSAKQQIDLLLLLKDKTKGNLEQQEQYIMDSLVYQLQMTYVEELKKEDGKEDNK